VDLPSVSTEVGVAAVNGCSFTLRGLVLRTLPFFKTQEERALAKTISNSKKFITVKLRFQSAPGEQHNGICFSVSRIQEKIQENDFMQKYDYYNDNKKIRTKNENKNDNIQNDNNGARTKRTKT
jgi:hypothetical protein